MTNLEKAAVRVMMLTDRSPEAIQAVIDFTHKMRDLLGGDKSVTMDSEEYRWITTERDNRVKLDSEGNVLAGFGGEFNGQHISAIKNNNQNSLSTNSTGEDIRKEEERQKIIDGTYPSKIMQGKQNKHIEGTHEFKGERERLQKQIPPAEPNFLLSSVKPQELVDKYKGTGQIEIISGSVYPREIIRADSVIGKKWIPSRGEHVDTEIFTIIYSSRGTHVFPTNPRKLD